MKNKLVITLLLFVATESVSGQPGPLASLQDRYSKLRSVHLTASLDMIVHGVRERPFEGRLSIEYWAEGDRYRVRCSSSPSLTRDPARLVGDAELAFDGIYWQRATVADSQLVFSRQDKLAASLACSNPLYLILDFLSPDGDECQGCDLRLPALLETWNVRATPVSGGAKSPEYRILGPKVGGTERSYVLALNAGSPQTIRQLTRFYPSGLKELELTVRKSIVPDKRVGPIPVQIGVKTFTPDQRGALGVDGTWTINVLEVNGVIDPGVFSLNWDSYASIYDDDARVFIKAKDDRVVGKPGILDVTPKP